MKAWAFFLAVALHSGTTLQDPPDLETAYRELHARLEPLEEGAQRPGRREQVELLEGFLQRFGKDAMNEYQTSLIDGDGDGIKNEVDDYAIAEDILIGLGASWAADIPNIDSVCGSQTLSSGTTEATIYAVDVTDMNGIEWVRAVITPPDYDPGNPDELWAVSANDGKIYIFNRQGNKIWERKNKLNAHSIAFDNEGELFALFYSQNSKQTELAILDRDTSKTEAEANDIRIGSTGYEFVMALAINGNIETEIADKLKTPFFRK